MTSPTQALEKLIEARKKAAFAKIHIINTEQVLVDFLLEAANFASDHAPDLLKRVRGLERELQRIERVSIDEVARKVARAALDGETT